MRTQDLFATSAVAMLVPLLCGCPPPGSTLSLIVSSQLADAQVGAKGSTACDPIDPVDISALRVTVDAIQIEEASGEPRVLTLFEGPREVTLSGGAEVRELISVVEIPPGKYVNAIIQISRVEVALATAPTAFFEAELAGDGVLAMPIIIKTDGGGQTLVVFALETVLCEAAGGAFEAHTELEVDFPTMLENVSATGVIDDRLVQERFELDSAEYEVIVDYAAAGGAIFLPTNGATPTGTVADLVEGAVVRVTGLFETNWMMDADQIQILQF